MPRFASIALLVIPAAAFLSSPALGGSTWDFDEEFASRHWRPESLEWAQAIHPLHPSYTWLIANRPPPAEEMWLHYSNYDDAPSDCATFMDLLDTWIRDHLGLGPADPIPQNLPLFPPEGVSACFPNG